MKSYSTRPKVLSANALGFPGVSLESGKRNLLIFCLFSCLPYLIGGLSPIAVGTQGADKYLWSFCSYLFVMAIAENQFK